MEKLLAKRDWMIFFIMNIGDIVDSNVDNHSKSEAWSFITSTGFFKVLL